MITRKNYFPSVCIVYTILVLSKLLMETIAGMTDRYYVANLISVFVICCVATLILSLHQFLPNIPLLFVIIGQYILLMVFILTAMYLTSFWSPVSEGGYFDMAVSVTIPYVIIATIYYISYFHDIKKANETIREFREEKRESSLRNPHSNCT